MVQGQQSSRKPSRSHFRAVAVFQRGCQLLCLVGLVPPLAWMEMCECGSQRYMHLTWVSLVFLLVYSSKQSALRENFALLVDSSL